jgi:hypothetical protein
MFSSRCGRSAVGVFIEYGVGFSLVLKMLW